MEFEIIVGKHKFNAFFDPILEMGNLCEYYPYNRISEIGAYEWRYCSWSLEILNYKEGKDEDIKLFISPFCELLSEVKSL